MGENTTTTQQSPTVTAPQAYAPAEPFINQILGGSQTLYNQNQTPPSFLQDPWQSYYNYLGNAAGSGTASQPFNASISGATTPMSVFGSSPQSYMDVLGQITSGINRVNTVQPWANTYGQALAQNAGPNAAMADLSGRAMTQNAYPNSTLADLAGSGGWNNFTYAENLMNLPGQMGAFSPSAARTYLSGIASGETNPFLNQLLDTNAERIGNLARSSASGSGRYGSFGMYDALNRTIAATNNPLLFQSAEADRNRQLQAAQQMDQALMAQGGLAAQLAGLGVNIGQNITQNRLNAANALTASQRADLGLGLQGWGQLAGSNRADLGLGQAGLTGWGNTENQNIANQTGASNAALNWQNQAINQQQQWAQLAPSLWGLAQSPYQAQFGLGQFMQQYPWNNLGMYGNALRMIQPAIGGTASSGSTTTQSTPTPWSTFAGLGLAGVGAGSSLFGAMGPFGALGAFSDMRAKTDIEYVGVDEATGLTLYAYRYKNDPKTYPKVVGPMAQEVAEKYPHMVGRAGDRLYIKV